MGMMITLSNGEGCNCAKNQKKVDGDALHLDEVNIHALERNVEI